MRCEPNCRKNRCKTVYKLTIIILFVLRRVIVDMFLNVGYDCEWMWSQCFYRCVSFSIFPLCIFVGVRDCLIAKGFLFAENLKIRCNQKQHRTCKHEKVEYAMHVSFVHAEYRCAEKTGRKSCEIYEARRFRYADG